MSRRLAIMAIYCKTRIVPKSVYEILRELRTVTEKLVVVCNGELQDEEIGRLRKAADLVLMRKNVGFDAGAYKYVLLDIMGSKALEKYDELILCNDTFFGFFRSLSTIFEEMDETCDFWGLNRVSNGILEYIESYFLVFRKGVLISKCFWEYWQNNISETETNIDEVYVRFEHEIYLRLCRNNFKPAAYTELNHMKLYEDSFHYVTEYQLPIIKKKAFAEGYFSLRNLLATLNYIKYNTNYDISLILNEVKKEFGIVIEIPTIDEYPWRTTVLERSEMNLSKCTGTTVHDFSEKGECYIFGTGLYGKLLYRNYVNKENVLGFIVSDTFYREKSCEGKEIISISELKNKTIRIILALSADNTNQVLPYISGDMDILNLWSD